MVTGDVTITGTTTSNCVKVASGVSTTITLDGVSINAYDLSHCALDLSEAGATKILLADGTTNMLRSGWDKAGIHVPSEHRVSIGGNGALNVSGRSGIGGGYPAPGGNTTINGGTITATSTFFGAGIGGGDHNPGGNITINGGIVTASS